MVKKKEVEKVEEPKVVEKVEEPKEITLKKTPLISEEVKTIEVATIKE